MSTLTTTRNRVSRNTSEAANRRLEERIERDVAFYAERPDLIDDRLAQLDREWDTERVLQANAASLALGGTVLGLLGDRRFFALPLVVGGFLLQHAVHGWCPPLGLLRALGVRTTDEINRERMALKVLRGDFDGTAQAAQGDARGRARIALAAVTGDMRRPIS